MERGARSPLFHFFHLPRQATSGSALVRAGRSRRLMDQRKLPGDRFTLVRTAGAFGRTTLAFKRSIHRAHTGCVWARLPKGHYLKTILPLVLTKVANRDISLSRRPSAISARRISSTVIVSFCFDGLNFAMTFTHRQLLNSCTQFIVSRSPTRSGGR